MIARDLGINVYSVQMDNNRSGMIAKVDRNSDPEIFLNSEHAPVRQRFTCAHELGHYFHNMTAAGPEHEAYVHRRDERSACGTYEEEIYANQFAAALLMPEPIVRELLAGYQDPVRVARELGVSLDALKHRMKNLGLTQW
ncbi:ImmA/IrrE family metallo-endopeptidase [Tomitella cavernea]|nr:ImmA/IrrE family metallo-endopeptidase [Tomitella cavernea]